MLTASYHAPAPAQAPGPIRTAPAAWQSAPAPWRSAPAPWRSTPPAYRLSGITDDLSNTGRAVAYLGLGAVAILGAWALWKATR